MNKKEKMYSVFVRGHAMQKIVCEVCPDYCGNLEFEITKIRVYDILGVWNFKIPNTHTLHVAVLPEMTEIADAMLKGGVEGFLEDEIYSNKRSGDDPSEIFRIREYLDGDKLNRIHWKLSAKEGALMVKDFGLPLDSSVVILLELYDLGEETEKIIDASIETAVSLSLQFIYLGQMHFIAWYDLYIDDIVRVRIQDEGDLYQALAKLFISDIYTQELQGLVAYQCRYRTEQYSNLFYITSLTKGNEMYRIREFARFSNCHITFITDSQEISPELKENLIESELVYSFVSPEQLYTDINKLTITVQE